MALLAAAQEHVPAPPRPSGIIGEVTSSDAGVHGSVVLTANSTQLLSGATVNAGGSAARVKLTRGGEVRVCPGTSLVLSASGAKQERLVLSLGTGSFEAHYDLKSTSDTILTPDFRLQLAGPGSFHIAVHSDSQGNACVRSLAGDTATVIINELMGEGSYQLKAGEQAYFRDGKVAGAAVPTEECGCPAPPEGRSLHMAGEFGTPPAFSEPETPAAETTSKTSGVQVAAGAVTAPLPPEKPGETQVQVEAPFVFRADEQAPASIPSPYTVARLHISQAPLPEVTPEVATREEPPAAAAAPAAEIKKKKGFFARVRGLLASMFGH